MHTYGCVHTGGQASSPVAPDRLPRLARRRPCGWAAPSWGAVLGSGGQDPREFLLRRRHERVGEGCAGWRRRTLGRRPGGAEDPERWEAGARLSPPTAGRGAGSAARGPRAPGSATGSLARACPSRRLPGSLGACPARGRLFLPSPRGACRSRRQRSSAERPGTERGRERGPGPGGGAAAAAAVPAGRPGVLPHAAGGRGRPSPGCLRAGSETCLPHRGLCCGSPPHPRHPRSPRYAHLPRRGCSGCARPLLPAPRAPAPAGVPAPDRPARPL